jgi:hypothetical protein
MTWKTKVSKANVLLFQLQASVHGIKGKGSGLSHLMFQTPTATEIPARSKEAMEKRIAFRKSIGRNSVPAGNLLEQIQTMYPTPRAADVEGGAVKNVQLENGHFFRTNSKGVRWGVKLRDAIEMYPTPRASAAMTEDLKTIAKRKKYNSRLEEKIAMGMYSTPTTNDAKNLTFCQSQQNRTSVIGNLMRTNQPQPGGKLNPHFVEFLMGFPMDWTKIDPTE